MLYSIKLITNCHRWKKKKKTLKVWVAQLYLTLCNRMNCSPPGSSVHKISQARILEWVAISFSRGSSWPGDQMRVSSFAGRFCTVWATRVAQNGNGLHLGPLSHGLPSLSSISIEFDQYRAMVCQVWVRSVRQHGIKYKQASCYRKYTHAWCRLCKLF